MKRLLLLLAVVLTAAGCGSSDNDAATTTASPATTPITAPRFPRASARTTAAHTVKFAQITSVVVGGQKVSAYTSGTVSFVTRLGHIYRIQPGSTVGLEVIVVGPWVYENANAQAALNDPTVRPWTKLDTRRLSAKERAAHPDDLAHALAPAYLAAAVESPQLVRTTPTRAVFTGTIDPADVAEHVPAAQRALIRTAVAGDYPAKPFPVRFWLDRRGRLRRVLVAYETTKGTPVSVDTAYDAFGIPIDATLPAPADTTDITPKT